MLMSETTTPRESAAVAAAADRKPAVGPPPGVATRGAGQDAGAPDLREHGAPVRGVPQTSTRRLFVQLHVFTECPPPNGIIAEVRRSGLAAVVYADLNDPRGIGVLLMSEDPALFAGEGRELLSNVPFRSLTPRPEMTMIGRTYSSGREADLEDFLLRKVPRNVLGPDYPWAVWYPLRRIGAFNQLPRAEQGRILMEHGMLGRRYGEAGLRGGREARMPRTRPRRQRVRDRSHRSRAVSAVAARQGHARHPADLGVHPADGAVLRRQGRCTSRRSPARPPGEGLAGRLIRLPPCRTNSRPLPRAPVRRRPMR